MVNHPQEIRFICRPIERYLEVVMETQMLPARQPFPRFRMAERNRGPDITDLCLNHIFIVPYTGRKKHDIFLDLSDTIKKSNLALTMLEGNIGHRH